MIKRATQVLMAISFGALTVGAGFVAWELGRSQIAAEVYRERLSVLADEHAVLREAYERAINRTAVTELEVLGGAVSVRVRSADGNERVIETPFTSASELYVDYVVVDGRLWVRRVFDEHTPASEGLVIDPDVSWVDWSGGGASHGKAIYRKLDEGRWVISVSGNGSLGLERAGSRGDETSMLEALPSVSEFEPLDDAGPEVGADPSWGEVMSALWRRLGVR